MFKIVYQGKNSAAHEVHVRSHGELVLWFAHACKNAVLDGGTFTYTRGEEYPESILFANGDAIRVTSN